MSAVAEANYAEHPEFRQTASAILEREPSGGRFAFQGILRLLAEVRAVAGVVCTTHPDTGRTAVAVWAADGYVARRLALAAGRGELARWLEGRRYRVVVDGVRLWGFDSSDMGLAEGWAVPIRAPAWNGIACLLFEVEKPNLRHVVARVEELRGTLAEWRPERPELRGSSSPTAARS